MKNVNKSNLETFANCVKATIDDVKTTLTNKINSMDHENTASFGYALSSITQADGKITSTGTTDLINRANKWTTARTITLGADCTGSVTIDGSSNVTLNVNVNDDSHNHTIANIDSLQTTLDGKAPINHAYAYTNYGVATDYVDANDTGLYGHVRLINSDLSGWVHSDGNAAGCGHTHSQYSLTTHAHDDRYVNAGTSDSEVLETLYGKLTVRNNATIDGTTKWCSLRLSTEDFRLEDYVYSGTHAYTGTISMDSSIGAGHSKAMHIDSNSGVLVLTGHDPTSYGSGYAIRLDGDLCLKGCTKILSGYKVPGSTTKYQNIMTKTVNSYDSNFTGIQLIVE